MSDFLELFKELQLTPVLQAQIRQRDLDFQKLQQEKDTEKRLREKFQEENGILQRELAEVVRYHRGTKFVKGRSTGHQWMPFCAACGKLAKVVDPQHQMRCVATPACNWRSEFMPSELQAVIAELGA